MDDDKRILPWSITSRNMPFCNKCGKYSAQIPCPYCGFNPIAQSQAQTMKTCVSCGALNLREAQWCVKCNRSLSWPNTFQERSNWRCSNRIVLVWGRQLRRNSSRQDETSRSDSRLQLSVLESLDVEELLSTCILSRQREILKMGCNSLQGDAKWATWF